MADEQIIQPKKKEPPKPKPGLSDEDKDNIRGAIYDVEVNLKKVEDAVYYVVNSYPDINLQRAQELMKELRKELGL